VGDGCKIFLWLDVWHPDGCLLDNYGHRVVYDAGSSIGAKLSTIIRNGDWFWPAARPDHLVDLQSKLPEVEIGDYDLPVWNCKKGKYACSKTWDAIRKKEARVQWWKVVWHSVAIPKHAFMLWLVFKDAMITKSRICGWGYEGDCLCSFCRSGTESRDHLFFECSFSYRIWKEILGLCLIYEPKKYWEEVADWSVVEMRHDCLRSRLCILSLGATVYNLWKHRNDILHGNVLSSEEMIIAKIKGEVRAPIMAKGPYKKSSMNVQLEALWTLHKIFN
jgi:hypothetical protein